MDKAKRIERGVAYCAACYARDYFAAARGFLQHAGKPSLAELTQADATGYCRRRPGQRANLMAFLSWLELRHRITLTSMKTRRTPPAHVEQRKISSAKTLMVSLETTSDRSKGLALLAAMISRLYDIPLARVLTINSTEGTSRDGSIVLWADSEDEVRFEQSVTAAWKRWVIDGDRRAFPARVGGGRLSTDAVNHHVTMLSKQGTNEPIMNEQS